MIAHCNSVVEIHIGLVSTGAKASSVSEALQKLEKLLTTRAVGRVPQQAWVLLSRCPVACPFPPMGVATCIPLKWRPSPYKGITVQLSLE